jgi:hypothetical protein
MLNRFITNRVAIHGLLAATLLGAAATANAQSALNSEVSGYDAIPMGDVSVTDLAASEANRQALELLEKAPAVERPKHRLPDGSLTSKPSQQMLRALQPSAEPNVDVTPGDALPRFTSITGFTGIFEGNNVTANHFESEPPDQGLAVHNNVVAEINNVHDRFGTANAWPPSGASPLRTTRSPQF